MNLSTQQNVYPFSINNVEMARLDISGNLAIGKTSSSQYALDVSGYIFTSATGPAMGVTNGVHHAVLMHGLACAPCRGTAPGVYSSIASITVGNPAFMADTGGIYILNAAIYDFWRIYLPFVAGTYTFTIDHGATTDRGIVSVVIDGTTVGSFDSYTTGALQNYKQSSITGISIPSTKLCKVELQINSKNASSSNYYFVWRKAGFYRTS